MGGQSARDLPGAKPDKPAIGRAGIVHPIDLHHRGTVPRGSAYRDDRQSMLEDISRRPSPVPEDPLRSNQPATGITDWSRASAPRPQPGSSAGSGGLTQLLRTLDEPAKGPEQPSPYPPPLHQTPPTPGGSIFTQAYKKLDQPVNPPSPGPTPSYSPPSRLSATQAFQPPMTGGIFPDAAAPNLPVGPSEVTRILDASKLREMQRQGGRLAPPPALPLRPSHRLLNLRCPCLRHRPTCSGSRRKCPRSRSRGSRRNLAPPCRCRSSCRLSKCRRYPRQLLRPAPALGKMQQYLPLLAIIIIFLLIVILVTVVFLLKH